jgi:hypothetical protein
VLAATHVTLRPKVPIDGVEAWRNFVPDEDDDPAALWRVETPKDAMVSRKSKDGCCTYTPLSCLSSEIATDDA